MWNDIYVENGKYVNAPEYNRPILAILQWSSGKTLPAVIKHVKEDDCSWRNVDDDSEISYFLDVIKWMYVPEY